ncbi:MAG: hypothetical protein QXW42_04190 [Thermofilum sp.]
MRVSGGNILPIVFIGFALIIVLAVTVSYAPQIMSLFSVGGERGILAEYEVHFGDDVVKGASSLRPMAGVSLSGYSQPVRKILLRPVLKINIPEKYYGREYVLLYRLRVMLNLEEAHSELGQTRGLAKKEYPLKLMVLTPDDFKEKPDGRYSLVVQVCDVLLRVEGGYESSLPECRTIISFVLDKAGTELYMVGGEDAPWRF